MQQIAIQDANILIDLLKTGLFAHCLVLDYQFMTTDLVFEELYETQQAEIQPHIDSGKFTLIRISKEELVEIQVASLEDKRLSEQDWSTVYYAAKWKTILVSGDKTLRQLAELKRIEVHGIFWLLDLLAENSILANEVCFDFLTSLVAINKRLPANEIKERQKRWSKSDK